MAKICTYCNKSIGWFSLRTWNEETGSCDRCAEGVQQRQLEQRKLEQRLLVERIRQGHLPQIDLGNSIYLDSDEVCHYFAYAVYHKRTSKASKRIKGKLIATNKKLLFLSEVGGMEVNWGKVIGMSIQEGVSGEARELWKWANNVNSANHEGANNVNSANHEGANNFDFVSNGSINLDLSVSTGHGRYDVPDIELAEAVFDMLVKISKRHIVSNRKSSERRSVPQHIKRAVWQRDEGRCVECGSTSDLHFDHVIPVSKGGSNIEKNIQLLCQTCNLRKHAKI